MSTFASRKLLFVLLLFAGNAASQIITATLVGRVTDQSGAAVSSASITVLNVSTGLTRKLLTDSQGDYVVSTLPVGEYQVTAEQVGFTRAVISGITLEVAQTPRVDIVLAVGDTRQEIEVAASVALMKTDSSDIGMVVDNRTLVDMPLNGRKLLDLNLLDAGAARLSNFRNDPAGDRSQNLGGAGISFNGSSVDGNNYLVDGLQSQGMQTTHMSYQPTLESVQEFKQQSNQYDAASGFGGGGQINVVTKSGTNSFHAEAYEYLRNDKVDARNFFDASKPKYRQNQFGGVVGGPVVKDHTFFFFSYEGFRVRKAQTQIFSVPSLTQRNGSFAGAATIYDPNTTRTDPANPDRYLRDPFPDNLIPAARIDPVARKALDLLIPFPNLAGNSANLRAAPLRTENSAEYSIRGDHRFTNAHSIFGRYTKYTNEKILNSFAQLPNAFNFTNNPASNLTFGYTAVLSSRLVNDLRAGWTTWQQVLEDTDGRFGAKIDWHARLGLNRAPTPDLTIALGQPRIAIAGFGATGGIVNSPNNRNDNNYQFADNFSFTTGGHQVSLGVTTRLWREDKVGLNTNLRGSYSTTARYTALPGVANTGAALGDFLLGDLTASGALEGTNFHDYHRNLFGSYIQDNWSIHRNLTLNLGMRWEYFGPWFDPNKQLTFFSFKSAQIVSTDDIVKEGLPPSSYRVSKRNIAPRIGLAWRPTGNSNTVVRAGFGMFHLPHVQLFLLMGLNFNPNVKQLNFNADPITPNLTLTNAFPDALASFGTLSATAVQPDWKTPYNEQWSLFIERQIARNLSVEMGYVGNRGINLEQSPNINTPLPGPGPLNSRRRYPAFGSISLAQPLGDSYYHALLANIQRKWQNGFSFKVSYAFSKALADVDLGAFAFQGGTGVKGSPFTLAQTNKGRTEFDARHRLVLSYLYEIPFGRGKRFASTATPFVDLVLGGWQVNGITMVTTGTPLDTSLAVDNAGTGGGGGDDRPNLVGDPNNGPRTPQQWFNTSAFALGPAGRYGNAARNVITAPGISNFDFSLFKIFRITEVQRLQFRTEFFNFFNHTQFDPPNGQFGTGNFGRIFSAGDGRQIQFALKYSF